MVTNKLAKNDEKGVSLLSANVIAEKFREIKDKLPELDNLSNELKVVTEQHLVVATNNVQQVAQFIKDVEKTKKLLGNPYYLTYKAINEYCKPIMDTLERIKSRFSSEIANYKIAQEATARAEAARKQKELDDLRIEKEEESKKITRIERQLIARIFGGIYYDKTGASHRVNGCLKSEDCNVLLKWVNETAPGKDKFKHYPNEYEEMLAVSLRRLAKHKADLIILESKVDPDDKAKAMENMTDARITAEIKSSERSEASARKVEKEIRHEEIKSEKEIAEAGKGLRSTLKFEVYDEKLIPREFLSIDNVKVNKFTDDNREQIKRWLQEGTEIIPGIKFFVEDGFVVR